MQVRIPQKVNGVRMQNHRQLFLYEDVAIDRFLYLH